MHLRNPFKVGDTVVCIEPLDGKGLENYPYMILGSVHTVAKENDHFISVEQDGPGENPGWFQHRFVTPEQYAAKYFNPTGN